jgi:membrane carboxypeptidase/penicillin-binding protein
VLSPEVARAMSASLQAVVDHEYGTAHSLRKLFPSGDLAGKTGTATRGDGSSVVTNLYVGATPKYLIATRLATIDRQPLGRKETGARNALPVFRDIVVNSHLFEAGELFTAIPDLSKGAVFTPPKYDYEKAHPEIIAQLEKMRLIDERRKMKKNPKSVLRLDGPASVTMHPPKQKIAKH